MQTEFKTYEEARAVAQKRANEMKLSMGIEKPTKFQRWTIKLVPAPKFRQGWELRCEIVDPE